MRMFCYLLVSGKEKGKPLVPTINLCPLSRTKQAGAELGKLSQGWGYSFVEVKISQELMYIFFSLILTYELPQTSVLEVVLNYQYQLG